METAQGNNRDDHDRFVGRTISHYQVLEKLGGGGMGVVYKALDTKLNRSVALKFLPPELTYDHEARERFIREAQAASALDDPHICTIYEIGEYQGQLFIAMACYEGQTLKKKIEQGPLPVEEALRYTIQIAQGLERAHEAGIVHRDLKPANVMVTSRGEVKILDFGLAKVASATTLTRTGLSPGTPAYMSPEQVRGGAVDQRTDLWGLGVVLYEMLTGERPFRGEYEQAVLYSILHEKPEPVRALRPEVSERLEEIVAKALQKNSSARYGSMATLQADLQAVGASSSAVPAAASAGMPSRRGKRRVAMLLTAALGVLGLVGLALELAGSESLVVEEDRVAVAPFENRTGDPSLDPLGSMAADWIAQGLSQTGLVEVVPPLTAMRASKETEGEAGSDMVHVLAEQTGAGKVITGSYYKQGDQLQIQAQVVEAGQGKLLAAVEPVHGTQAAPMEAVEQLRRRVMSVLANHLHPRLRSWSYSSSQPPSFEAYQAYVQGLEMFTRLDMEGAIYYFNQASSFDSTYTLPLLWAGVAHLNLEQYERADSIARLVNRYREELAPLDRYMAEWLQASTRGDLAGALRATRQIVEVAPGSEYLYGVALDALRLNRPREAVDALSQIDPEKGWMKGWVSYWGVLTEAYHLLGDHRQELEAAQRSRRQYPDLLWTLFYEARALATLGRVEQAIERLDESLNLLPQQGMTPADVMWLTAAELRAHGHEQAAQDVLDRTLAWYRSRPDAEAAAENHQYGLAQTLYQAGRWEEASALFEELAARDTSNIDYLGYQGVIAARQGAAEKAREIDRQLQQIQRPYVFGRPAFWRARIAALLGEHERAVTLLRSASAQGWSYEFNHTEGIDFEPLRDYPPFQELMRPKG